MGIKKEKQLTFEQKLERLQAIVEILDAGESPLDDMITLYEEGMALAAESRQYLQNTEQKIEIIEKRSRSAGE